MFKNVLVAVDGSRHADAALDQAIDIARTQGARLTLLTAWQSYSGWASLGAGAPIPDDFTAGIQDYYRRTLDQAVARVPAELAPRTLLVEGSAGDAILNELEHGSYDLVVMGSRGRGAVGSLLLGSVSHRVLHHAPIPTLIVHLANEAAPGR